MSTAVVARPPRLPFKPWLFIGAVVAVALTSLAGSSLADEAQLPLFAVVTLAYVALWTVWAGQATAFAAAHGDPGHRRQALRLFSVCAAILGLAWLVNVVAVELTGFLVRPPTDEQPSPALMAAASLTLVGMIGTCWTAARALCRAERARGLARPGLFQTTRQFVFLIYAAPALHRRLKALGDGIG